MEIKRFQSPLGDFLYCQPKEGISISLKGIGVSVPVRGFFILSAAVVPYKGHRNDVSVPVRGFFILSVGG